VKVKRIICSGRFRNANFGWETKLSLIVRIISGVLALVVRGQEHQEQ